MKSAWSQFRMACVNTRKSFQEGSHAPEGSYLLEEQLSAAGQPGQVRSLAESLMVGAL